MSQPERVRILVENIPHLAASAALDLEGTLWVVVGECHQGESRREAAVDAVTELLGPEGLPAVLACQNMTIEFGASCTRFQPAAPAKLMSLAS